MFTRVSSEEKTWKGSPGHPNSMQKHNTQAQYYAGETARERLEITRYLLWFRRTVRK